MVKIHDGHYHPSTVVVVVGGRKLSSWLGLVFFWSKKITARQSIQYKIQNDQNGIPSPIIYHYYDNQWIEDPFFSVFPEFGYKIL